MTDTLIKTSPFTQQQLANGISYTQYQQLIDRLLAENKTTGDNHSADLVEYTRLNMHRMNRVEKTAVLEDDLVLLLLSVQTKMTWVVLTEAWCGDAAQNLPAIMKMANASPLIEVTLLLRDEHPEIMDAYLTRGTRSIPKLIALDSETLEVLGTWGPRPAPAQQLVLQAKSNHLPSNDIAQQLHTWYAKNRSRTIQQEFKQLLRNWSELTAPQDQLVERCS